MSKHTPGPWHWDPEGRIYRTVPAGSGYGDHTIPVARCVTDEQDERIGASEAEFNARLIAAAPTLLEFVRNIDKGSWKGSIVDAMNQARALVYSIEEG